MTDASVWLVTGANTPADAVEDLPLYMTYYICFVSEVLFMSDALAVRARLASVNQILTSAIPRAGHRGKRPAGTLVAAKTATVVHRSARLTLPALAQTCSSSPRCCREPFA